MFAVVLDARQMSILFIYAYFVQFDPEQPQRHQPRLLQPPQPRQLPALGLLLLLPPPQPALQPQAPQPRLLLRHTGLQPGGRRRRLLIRAPGAPPRSSLTPLMPSAQ